MLFQVFRVSWPRLGHVLATSWQVGLPVHLAISASGRDLCRGKGAWKSWIPSHVLLKRGQSVPIFELEYNHLNTCPGGSGEPSFDLGCRRFHAPCSISATLVWFGPLEGVVDVIMQQQHPKYTLFTIHSCQDSGKVLVPICFFRDRHNGKLTRMSLETFRTDRMFWMFWMFWRTQF